MPRAGPIAGRLEAARIRATTSSVAYILFPGRIVAAVGPPGAVAWLVQASSRLLTERADRVTVAPRRESPSLAVLAQARDTVYTDTEPRIRRIRFQSFTRLAKIGEGHADRGGVNGRERSSRKRWGVDLGYGQDD